MSAQPVLIDGSWVVSAGTETFQAVNPKSLEKLPESYPVSPWAEIERSINASARAADACREWPGERFAAFLDKYADLIDANAAKLVPMAHQETGLPAEPRLAKAELPRTSNQLRQGATAARDASWTRPIIDSAANIRSCFAPLGPVVVFGPNNFPFAFNSVAGGDFAAAVAAGNPVIAKGHSSHPGTTRLFAELAHEAAVQTQMPPGFVQLIYRTSHADGAKLVSHPKIGATGYTGARSTGLVLKEAADKAGKPIYLELSSINPVCVLPGALAERSAALVDEFAGSCLMGSGQLCTNPGLVLLIASTETDAFIAAVKARFEAAPVGTLLSEGVRKNLAESVQTLITAGAELVAGGKTGGGQGVSYGNTLLKATGQLFLKNPRALQTEAFGNESLFIICTNIEEMQQVLGALEGSLTGAIYSASDNRDDALYAQIVGVLRSRVGRLLNDKMPTGVAVTAAMNHGGPFPATGHPGFTAVGMPTAVQRFAALQCYDAVRQQRLPAILQNKNPTGKMWRMINGQWSQADAT